MTFSYAFIIKLKFIERKEKEKQYCFLRKITYKKRKNDLIIMSCLSTQLPFVLILQKMHSAISLLCFLCVCQLFLCSNLILLQYLQCQAPFQLMWKFGVVYQKVKKLYCVINKHPVPFKYTHSNWKKIKCHHGKDLES